MSGVGKRQAHACSAVPAPAGRSNLAPAQAAPATHAFQPGPAPDTIDRAGQATHAFQPAPAPDTIDRLLVVGSNLYGTTLPAGTVVSGAAEH